MSKSVEALERIKQMDQVTITAELAAPVIGSDPNTIRLQARQAPEKLGFPVICVGSRVKIPRIPFIWFVEGKEHESEKQEVKADDDAETESIC